jgi:hypothetical protein
MAVVGSGNQIMWRIAGDLNFLIISGSNIRRVVDNWRPSEPFHTCKWRCGENPGSWEYSHDIRQRCAESASHGERTFNGNKGRI